MASRVCETALSLMDLRYGEEFRPEEEYFGQSLQNFTAPRYPCAPAPCPHNSFCTLHFVLMRRPIRGKVQNSFFKGRNVYGRETIRMKRVGTLTDLRRRLEEYFPVLRGLPYDLFRLLADQHLEAIDPMLGISDIKQLVKLKKLYIIPTMALPRTAIPQAHQEDCAPQQAGHMPQAGDNLADSEDELPDVLPVTPTSITSLFATELGDGAELQQLQQQHSGTPTVQLRRLTTLGECLLVIRPETIETRSLLLHVDRHQRHNVLWTMMEAVTVDNTMNKRPNVQFIGECGIDNGGMSAEAMSIAIQELSDSPLFKGAAQKRTFSWDAKHLKSSDYLKAGRLCAYIMAWGGQLPQFFHGKTCSLILDPQSDVKFSRDDLPQPFQEWVTEIAEATEAEFEVLMDKYQYVVILAGAKCMAEYDQKQDLVQTLCHYLGVVCQLPSVYQFRAGLKALGVLAKVEEYPDIMKWAFVAAEEPVTADQDQPHSPVSTCNSTDNCVWMKQESDQSTYSLVGMKQESDQSTESLIRMKQESDQSEDSGVWMKQESDHITDSRVGMKQESDQSTESLIRMKQESDQSDDSGVWMKQESDHITDSRVGMKQESDQNSNSGEGLKQEAN